MTPETTLRRLYELIDKDDHAGMAALFEPDAVYHRPGHDALVGRETIRRFYAVDRHIAAGAHTLDRIIVSGTRAAVDGSFTGATDDGRPLGHRFAEIFELSEAGRFTRRDSFLFISPI
ncbi:hypothetical protein Aph01nite_59620 [Acrocarpospora phusangensis]|uniref:SnoaL-like domain-containing protein n=1 Tax=Acrocarpospora phusangensis TaxID=1070424 RepID=A0A919QEV4_9ACTN|nr:nuclear transport factor 2 family protein [Acrocarpospora phusangensis]GIH27652.1 hypothetical protein Aph01nite_59620 [Acrocarpospora phusangensis]